MKAAHDLTLECILSLNLEPGLGLVSIPYILKSNKNDCYVTLSSLGIFDRAGNHAAVPLCATLLSSNAWSLRTRALRSRPWCFSRLHAAWRTKL